MLRWHMTLERKLVEQSVLPALTFPHHRQHSNPPDRIESPPPCFDNSRFFQHNPPTADLPTVPAAAFTVSGTKHMPSEIAGARIAGRQLNQIRVSRLGNINEKYRPSGGHQQTYNRAVEPTE